MVATTSQTGVRHPSGPKTFKPRNSEENKWKVNQDDVHYKKTRSKLTFDHLLTKYVNQAVVSENQPREKHPRSLVGHIESNLQQRDATRPKGESYHEQLLVVSNVPQPMNLTSGPGIEYAMNFQMGHVLHTE
jgi:hypothetical protein